MESMRITRITIDGISRTDGQMVFQLRSATSKKVLQVVIPTTDVEVEVLAEQQKLEIKERNEYKTCIVMKLDESYRVERPQKGSKKAHLYKSIGQSRIDRIINTVYTITSCYSIFLLCVCIIALILGIMWW